MYKLQGPDLDYLYPYFYPSQIEKQFGSASPTARSIQMHYRRKGLPPVDEAMELIIKGSYAIADMDIPSEDWIAYFMDELQKIKQQRQEKIWIRINGYYE